MKVVIAETSIVKKVEVLMVSRAVLISVESPLSSNIMIILIENMLVTSAEYRRVG